MITGKVEFRGKLTISRKVACIRKITNHLEKGFLYKKDFLVSFRFELITGTVN